MLVVGDLVSTVALTDLVAWSFIKVLEEGGAPWLFGTDTAEDLLREWGWIAEDVKQPGGEGFGRWPCAVLRRQIPDVPRNFLFTAVLA